MRFLSIPHQISFPPSLPLPPSLSLPPLSPPPLPPSLSLPPSPSPLSLLPPPPPPLPPVSQSAGHADEPNWFPPWQECSCVHAGALGSASQRPGEHRGNTHKVPGEEERRDTPKEGTKKLALHVPKLYVSKCVCMCAVNNCLSFNGWLALKGCEDVFHHPCICLFQVLSDACLLV